MSRLPFDPGKVARPDAGKPARRDSKADADALTVTQLTLLIRDTLAEHTPRSIRLVGELGDFSRPGHWFLSLKDEQNKIDCVMWRSAAGKVGFEPERGMQLLATGRLDFYGPQGRVQMYLDRLEPVGRGALELRFRQLCEELRGQGYFDPARKRPLPAFPQRIAVVTSATGAALQDVIHTARHRWPGIGISVVDVRVQGAAAAGQIAQAIHTLGQPQAAGRFDAILITRGGGSLEDLWAFNERVVADAVYRAAVPTVAAIGHEVDTTIAELVADLRCSTPTQAAERLVPDVRAEHQRLDHHGHRLLRTLIRSAELGRQTVESLGRHELFRRPQMLAEQGRGRVNELQRRLGRALGTKHEAARKALAATERQLHAVSPREVLRRGYSYTTDAAGRVIRTAGEVDAGDRIRTHLVDGHVDSTVDGPVANPAPPARAGRRRTSRPDADQPGLF